MIEKLQKLLNNSYSPYYNFPVSCILITNDDNTFHGVNIETSSPNAGICAERNAIYSAITKGYKKGDFKELHIMNKTNDFVYPCFICRQTIIDLCPNIKIYVYNYKGDKKEVSLEELCPYPFSKENLKWKAVL